MNDNTRVSVAQAIASKLTEDGQVPDGGMLTEVQYVAVAKVRTFDADGTQTVSYRFFDNLGRDEDAKMSMAHRMVWETERQARRG